jgi:hypothetical protein
MKRKRIAVVLFWKEKLKLVMLVEAENEMYNLVLCSIGFEVLRILGDFHPIFVRAYKI